MIARGRVHVPGDKSITHRALMLAALCDGECRFEGALAALDTRATASCLRALGIAVSPLGEGRPLTVRGRGLLPFRRPARTLDCKNSGTTARLLMGLLAAHRFSSTLTGDASLRRRPMARIAGPLGEMGARIRTTDGRLPLTVRGGALQAIDYASPVASAQVKTALLFAGLAGGVAVRVTEPVRSRDHTERLLTMLGVRCAVRGHAVALEPVSGIPAFGGNIPGDFSSAAYLVAAAIVAGDSEVSVDGWDRAFRAAHEAAHYAEAVRWASLLVASRQQLVGIGPKSDERQNDLAAAYMNRGVARSDAGDGAGAIEDYGQAIALRADLQERLQPSGQWPPAWQNDLALAIMNRGLALEAGPEPAQALESYASYYVANPQNIRDLRNERGPTSFDVKLLNVTSLFN